MDASQHPNNALPEPPDISLLNTSARPSTKWISVSLRPPGKCTGYPIMLNNNEFVLPIGDHQMVKYNARRNEWSLFLTMEKPLKFEQRAVAIDSNTNRMYLSGSRSDITIVDLETESIVHRQLGHTANHGPNDPDQGLFCADGVMHRQIGWNQLLSSCYVGPQVHDLVFSTKVRGGAGRMRSPFMLHVPSKGIILMVGTVHTVTGVGLWQYHIAQDKWTQMLPKDRTANLMSTMSCISGCGIVLTSDEKYVIILGDPIKILDIRFQKYRLRESTVSPPLVSDCYVARSGGSSEFVTTGYVRRLFSSKEFCNQQMPALAIVDMIASYGSQEMIHWLANGTSAQHFKAGLDHRMISLADILKR